MKAAIYYHSTFGNGGHLMDMLKTELSALGYDVSVFKISSKVEFQAADLCVFSSPTHAANPVGKMKKFIAKIPENNGCYGVVTTYGVEVPPTLDTMSNALDAKGMKKMADLAVKVKKMRGPLEDDAPAMVKQFAESLHSGCQN